MRTPETFSLNVRDIRFLIAESPRFRLVLGEFREGMATARELARCVWPDADPDAIDPRLKLTPSQWMTEILDYEAAPCQAGGGGTIRREGDKYISGVPFGPRPDFLPQWQTN